MRLPGDTACFVELTHVTVLPAGDDPDQRPFLKGAEASVTCASIGNGGEWAVVVRGGVGERPLGPGDRASIRGVHVVTQDRFSVPAVLECAEAGATARFTGARSTAAARPRWAVAAG